MAWILSLCLTKDEHRATANSSINRFKQAWQKCIWQTNLRLSEINTCLEISDQIALFGATKLHATGPEHGKVKHGMELLKELNKSPLVTLSQKGSENTIAST